MRQTLAPLPLRPHSAFPPPSHSALRWVTMGILDRFAWTFVSNVFLVALAVLGSVLTSVRGLMAALIQFVEGLVVPIMHGSVWVFIAGFVLWWCFKDTAWVTATIRKPLASLCKCCFHPRRSWRKEFKKWHKHHKHEHTYQVRHAHE